MKSHFALRDHQSSSDFTTSGREKQTKGTCRILKGTTESKTTNKGKTQLSGAELLKSPSSFLAGT